MNKNTVKKGLLPYLFLVLVIFGVYYLFNVLNNQPKVLTYNELIKALDEGTVTEMSITPRERAVVYEIYGKLKDYSENERFFIRVPLTDSVIKNVLEAGSNNEFKLTTNVDPESSSFWLIIVNVLPIVLIVGFGFFFLTRQMNGANKSMDFGKSRARLSNDNGKVTFKDVAGLKEEKEEVSELIDFLKNPKKFTKLGARIPKGVLLVGPPGTGKTLLAKAVAGEANVPFYFISGSDFVELFVGVGASRVRDMFKQAKHTAPCLIFIDEIDAVGRQRGTGLGGGHDEREQTLNQLLTEMDGFGANEGIIIMAATNRADVLDPALLRPGRFDRQVTVDLPDVREREEILKVHARNKVLAPSVKLEYLAKRTPGFSGAALENLLNEAALLAVRRNKEAITMSEIDEATDRVIGGPAKLSRKYTEHERQVVAYHEAGHAVVSRFLPTQDAVHEISIVPRGMAGGYTMYQPTEDKSFMSKTEMIEQIISLLGGRASEDLMLDDISTGASNDIERATKIANAMVTKYGMSKRLGTITLGSDQQEVFLGRDFAQEKTYSEETAGIIDEEMKRIIDSCYAKAIEILKANEDKLHAVAKVLLEKEKITGEEFESIFTQQ